MSNARGTMAKPVMENFAFMLAYPEALARRIENLVQDLLEGANWTGNATYNLARAEIWGLRDQYVRE